MTQEKYDIRDDFHTRVDTLPHSAVSDVLPSCPYNPSYLVSKKLRENEAFKKGYVSLVPLYFMSVRFNTLPPLSRTQRNIDILRAFNLRPRYQLRERGLRRGPVPCDVMSLLLSQLIDLIGFLID